MPIYSIQEKSFASIATIGKLRKGEPKGAKQPGRDTDHFRFTSDDPAVMAAFKAAYGSDRVKELHVYLPYARLESNWDYWFETWGGKRIKYRCDGRNWVKWLLPDGKGYSRDPKPCPYCSGQETPPPGDHKPTGRLKLILPELLQAGHRGTVLLTTTAFSDIYSINGTFLFVAESRTDGSQDLNGIEFILRRELRDVPSREHGIQKRHVVALETMAEWIQAQLDRGRASPLPPMDLTTGEIIDDEEPPDFEDEPGDEPGQPDMSWKTDRAKQAQLEVHRKSLGLTAQEAMTALSISKYSEFDGPFETILQLMDDYAAWKAQKAEEDADAPPF
jgi:hypothetical protein